MQDSILAPNNERTKAFFVSMDFLNNFEEFASFQHDQKFQIIDFIQYAYHKESPFVREIESITDRLYKCLSVAEINEESIHGIYLVSVGKDLIASKVATIEDTALFKGIDNMISCYLSRIQHSNDFEMYITLQVVFWEYTERLRTKVSILLDEDKALKAMDTKVKITDPCLNLITTINDLRGRIFGVNEKAAKKADEKIKQMKPTADNMAKR